MAGKTKSVCPVCGKPSDFNTPPIGTFCSRRCKMVDLGKWLNADYRVSESLRPDHLLEYEEMMGEQLDMPERE